jgi:hypothetical protein
MTKINKGDSVEQDYDFIDSSGDSKHINNIINELLHKDNIIIYWSARKDETLVNGITVKKCSFTPPPQLTLKIIRTVLKNSCGVSTDCKAINKENSLVTIKLSSENLFELLPDLINYEVYINDEDFEFNWLGLKSHKIVLSQKATPVDLTFRFITERKGPLDVNKISIALLFKTNDKPIIINNFPAPIFIDIK